jgi:class 3 adenylate cyclase
VPPKEKEDAERMVAPPSGTVTFLFTDIEGSSRLWEESPETMRTALGPHAAQLLEKMGGVAWTSEYISPL